MVVAAIGMVLFVLMLRGSEIGPGWLGLVAGGFVILVLLHEPIRKLADRSRRAVEFYKKGLARLDERWAGTGVTGEEFLDVNHPYAADLDIFGTGSLFDRLCRARTRAGEETLANWLLAPATVGIIVERQRAITELRPRLDLREDLELLGQDIRTGIDPGGLKTWGSADRVFTGTAVPIVAMAVAVAGTFALVGWLMYGRVGLVILLIILAMDGVLARLVASRVKRVLSAVDRRTHDLVLLAEMLHRLEREPLESPLLQRLERMLGAGGLPASAQIRRLARLLHLLDCQRNQLFAPFAAIWLWRVQIALRIDAWRSSSGHEIAKWLAATGEFEALCSLASYAAENPDDPFPAVSDGIARYEAEELGHPLISRRDCVRNDVRLGGEVQVYIVSGSNMSGKSTLLRSVGINAVLALAGAPVRARSLRLSPVAIGATLRIQDLLQAGRSRFYAEITRVRDVVDRAAGPLPLLFLFDELFHGTNSHDRAVGAEAVLRGLIERRAIGLITTHDLALTQIADNLAPRAVNVHFEDHLENGTMHFDYRMRPGIVQHSNALALMRAIGLDV
jgi:hypothetical protein